MTTSFGNYKRFYLLLYINKMGGGKQIVTFPNKAGMLCNNESENSVRWAAEN